MANYIDLKEFRKAKRKAAIRERFYRFAQNTTAWIETHQHFLLTTVPAMAAFGGGVVRFARKHHTLSVEKHLKEDYVYDRSLGRYLKPTRKLSKKERRDAARRKANGEKYVDIFDSMGVL